MWNVVKHYKNKKSKTCELHACPIKRGITPSLFILFFLIKIFMYIFINFTDLKANKHVNFLIFRIQI